MQCLLSTDCALWHEERGRERKREREREREKEGERQKEGEREKEEEREKERERERVGGLGRQTRRVLPLFSVSSSRLELSHPREHWASAAPL